MSRLVASFARKPAAAAVGSAAGDGAEAAAWRRTAVGGRRWRRCAGRITPTWQIVFGVQDAADPAVAVVRRLQARFPAVDIALVADPTLHGRNRKVGNLINMMPAARHDVLVIADSDVHVRPDYLDRLVAALEQPGVGLVTTLYAGLPARLPDPRGRTTVPTGLPASVPRRSPTASCPAPCWRGRSDGRTAWARRCACAGTIWSASAASMRWLTTWRTTTCWGGASPRLGLRCRAGRHGAADDGAGNQLSRAVPARIALGAHHPGAGTSRLRRLGVQYPLAWALLTDPAGRRRAVVASVCS